MTLGQHGGPWRSPGHLPKIRSRRQPGLWTAQDPRPRAQAAGCWLPPAPNPSQVPRALSPHRPGQSYLPSSRASLMGSSPFVFVSRGFHDKWLQTTWRKTTNSQSWSPDLPHQSHRAGTRVLAALPPEALGDPVLLLQLQVDVPGLVAATPQPLHPSSHRPLPVSCKDAWDDHAHPDSPRGPLITGPLITLMETLLPNQIRATLLPTRSRLQVPGTGK